MFPLAIACLLIGLVVLFFFFAGVLNTPIISVSDWVAALGFGLLVAGIVFAAYGFLGWMGWGVPDWLIWLTAVGGVFILGLSLVGTIGDPLGRSPIESYPFLVSSGCGVLAAAVVAGVAY